MGHDVPVLRVPRMAAIGFIAGVSVGCTGSDGVTVACVTGADILAVPRTAGFEGVAQVVVSIGDRAELVTGDWVATGPSFSRDGRLVVVRARGDYESAGPDGTSLWVLGPGGTDARRLTDGPFDDEPDWSPDDETIAYSTRPASGGRRIMSVRASGGEPAPLFPDGPWDDHAPAWSADGHRIAWIRSEVGASDRSSVWVADTDGKDARPVASVVLGGHSLDWHPDGQTLLVNTYASGTGGIFAVDLATGDIRSVTTDALFGEWSADGTAVYYLTAAGGPESAWRVARGRIVDDHLERERFVGGLEGFPYPYRYLGLAVRPCDAAPAPAGPG
jgi:Tol biopolymer transport system component